MLGPCTFNTYDTRFAMLAMLTANPRAFFPNSVLITAKLVFIAPDADVNTDLSGQVLFGSNLQTCPRISRIFHRHPRMLQEQSLLRVDVFRFPGEILKNIGSNSSTGNEAAPFAV